MLNHKLILGALVAGCLSISSAWSQDKPGLTDEQKAKIAEIKQRIEEKRGAMKGRHDSLCAAHKDEIAKRIDAHKAALGKLSEERKAEWEKKMAERKADLDARLKDIEGKRADWVKNHPGAKDGISPEKLAELRKKIEDCIKDAEDAI